MSPGRARAERRAALQMSAARRGDTRLKSLARNPEREWLLVSWSILSSIPSSIPFGCGLISRGAGGSSWYVLGCSFGSASGGAYVSFTRGYAMVVCPLESWDQAASSCYRVVALACDVVSSRDLRWNC